MGEPIGWELFGSWVESTDVIEKEARALRTEPGSGHLACYLARLAARHALVGAVWGLYRAATRYEREVWREAVHTVFERSELGAAKAAAERCLLDDRRDDQGCREFTARDVQEAFDDLAVVRACARRMRDEFRRVLTSEPSVAADDGGGDHGV